MICEQCGATFEGREGQRFCARPCRNAFHNARLREAGVPRVPRKPGKRRPNAPQRGLVRATRLRRGQRPLATRAPYGEPATHLYTSQTDKTGSAATPRRRSADSGQAPDWPGRASGPPPP
jgi:hypothetical protein